MLAWLTNVSLLCRLCATGTTHFFPTDHGLLYLTLKTSMRLAKPLPTRNQILRVRATILEAPVQVGIRCRQTWDLHEFSYLIPIIHLCLW
jgi:hypothetical protein